MKVNSTEAKEDGHDTREDLVLLPNLKDHRFCPGKAVVTEVGFVILNAVARHMQVLVIAGCVFSKEMITVPLILNKFVLADWYQWQTLKVRKYHYLQEPRHYGCLGTRIN